MKTPAPAQVHQEGADAFFSAATLPFDFFTDILGNRPVEDVQKKLEKGPASAQTGSLGEWVKKESGDRQGYFFSPDPDQRFCTEVLYLKVALFLKVSRWVRQHHSSEKKPLFTLSPEEITVLFCLADLQPVPAKWGFSLHTVKPAPPLPVETPGISESAPLFQPGRVACEFFAAPEIVQRPFSAEQRADFAITGMVRTEENPGSLGITMRLSSKKVKYSDYGTGDAVQIFLKCNDTEIDELNFWGGVSETPKKSFLVIASIPDLDGKIENALKKRVGSTFFETKIILFKRHSSPCDLYTLGKIFFRMLLVNDKNSLSNLDERLSEVISVIDDSFKKGASDQAFIENRLFSKINEFDAIFSKKNILYCHDERLKTENRIPDEIWRETMILGFRLVTNIEAFSLCTRKPDTKMEETDAVLNELISRLELILSTLKTELFTRQTQNHEILEILKVSQEVKVT